MRYTRGRFGLAEIVLNRHSIIRGTVNVLPVSVYIHATLDA